MNCVLFVVFQYLSRLAQLNGVCAVHFELDAYYFPV